MDRFCSRQLTLLGAVVLALGCTLITDVDRSKIPEPPVITPDPQPDAGALADAGSPPVTPEDAGPDAAPGDAGADAALGDAGPGDAGPDAQADGG